MPFDSDACSSHISTCPFGISPTAVLVLNAKTQVLKLSTLYTKETSHTIAQCPRDDWVMGRRGLSVKQGACSEQFRCCTQMSRKIRSLGLLGTALVFHSAACTCKGHSERLILSMGWPGPTSRGLICPLALRLSLSPAPPPRCRHCGVAQPRRPSLEPNAGGLLTLGFLPQNCELNNLAFFFFFLT